MGIWGGSFTFLWGLLAEAQVDSDGLEFVILWGIITDGQIVILVGLDYGWIDDDAGEALLRIGRWTYWWGIITDGQIASIVRTWIGGSDGVLPAKGIDDDIWG